MFSWSCIELRSSCFAHIRSRNLAMSRCKKVPPIILGWQVLNTIDKTFRKHCLQKSMLTVLVHIIPHRRSSSSTLMEIRRPFRQKSFWGRHWQYFLVPEKRKERQNIDQKCKFRIFQKEASHPRRCTIQMSALQNTLFEKSNFCPKIQFWQNLNIFTTFSAKFFFDNFSREIKVVNS